VARRPPEPFVPQDRDGDARRRDPPFPASQRRARTERCGSRCGVPAPAPWTIGVGTRKPKSCGTTPRPSPLPRCLAPGRAFVGKVASERSRRCSTDGSRRRRGARRSW
jgi:hypothetical protein